MPYLKSNISKPWGSALAGDEVSIIADHGNVSVIKTKDGFTVSHDELTEDLSQCATIEPQRVKPETPKKVKKLKLH